MQIPRRLLTAVNRIRAYLSVLTETEREVFRFRNGLIDGQLHTLEETGKRMRGVSRERIRQIEERIEEKMNDIDKDLTK